MNAISDPKLKPSAPFVQSQPKGEPGLAHGIAGSAPARLLVNSGFRVHSRIRMAGIRRLHPLRVQQRTLDRLLAAARETRFGREHLFSTIRGVSDYQNAVPLRTYEELWNDYLRAAYPVLENLTWPGRIPYLALTSGTTQGATKYIPVSQAMVRSNRKAAQTMVASHIGARPGSRLFQGRLFFLGGTTALEEPAPGIRQGDLSGIAALEVSSLLRPYTFPPLELALESDWDRKLSLLASRSLNERITLVSGVPSWLLMLFQRVLELSGKTTIGEVWPHLELVVHGGVRFDPYRRSFQTLLGSPNIRLQETYPCSEGFIAYGDPRTGLLRLLLDHGLFYEFVPVEELDAPSPTRHWIGNAECGVNYAIVVSTCAGMWSHVIGDTVSFESLDPPLIRFTGRTRYTLSAFGEHLINEEVESALSEASARCGADIRDWHVGPVFEGSLGHHLYVIEFLTRPSDLEAFREVLDRELSVRNADYKAHRGDIVGLPRPAILVASPGSFDAWMRARGKLGGQNKVPRMDNQGTLTSHLVTFLREGHRLVSELRPS